MVLIMTCYLTRQLQRIGPVKLRKNKLRKQYSLWNDIPSLGREAMIATIENESELIKELKRENNQEYDKLHFFKCARQLNSSEQEV